jgi:hypothetical protein
MLTPLGGGLAVKQHGLTAFLPNSLSAWETAGAAFGGARVRAIARHLYAFDPAALSGSPFPGWLPLPNRESDSRRRDSRPR